VTTGAPSDAQVKNELNYTPVPFYAFMVLRDLYTILDIGLLMPALERLQNCVTTTSKKHFSYFLFSVVRLTRNM